MVLAIKSPKPMVAENVKSFIVLLIRNRLSRFFHKFRGNKIKSPPLGIEKMLQL